MVASDNGPSQSCSNDMRIVTLQRWVTRTFAPDSDRARIIAGNYEMNKEIKAEAIKSG